jgi:flavin-dependent dehydrogenase
MRHARHLSVAILGAGPAGATLAALLARAGHRVAVFSRRSPALVVGESQVPAVVPILRMLGIEDEVREYSVYKPGASFFVDREYSIEIDFAEACVRIPPYAYNVPRERFDATLQALCQRSGAELIDASAEVERVPGSEHERAGARLRLTGEAQALAVASLGAAPDLLIDASGRSRLFSRKLGLPQQGQDRRDAALFAHCSGVRMQRPGHVHSDRVENGWCWRIPLPGRVSVGVVAKPELLRALGSTPEEQFDRFIANDPHMKPLTEASQRLTPVVRYGNYQLTTRRAVGPGWALVGDAFGFIDPVFSSGLFLAMDGACKLAAAIQIGSPAALRRYERNHLRHIDAWRRVISTFYDGRFFALFRSHARESEQRLGPHISRLLWRQLAGVFTGEATARRFNRWLLDFMLAHALGGQSLDELRIR